MPRLTNYRFVDENDVVHAEHPSNNVSVLWQTACRLSPQFGQMWTTDYKLVVTCLQCLGRKS